MFIGTLTKLLRLKRSLNIDDQKLQKYRLDELNSLVSHAHERVPLYKELYGDNPPRLKVMDDISRLPFVTKSILKANFPDLTVDKHVDRNKLYPVATSGTSDRVMLFQDEYKRDWDRAADLLLAMRFRHFRPGKKRMVIPPDVCYERCGMDAKSRQQTLSSSFKDLFNSDRRLQGFRGLVKKIVDHIYWRNYFIESLGVDGTAISIDKVTDYFDNINNIKPWMLNALPFYMFILAKRKPETCHTVGVNILCPSGGKATPYMINKIEEVFDGRFRENYGTAEMGTISFDCDHSRHQHLLNNLFIVEFIRGGRPCAPDELGEMVITDLCNKAAPIIRYKVGDVGRYFNDACSCGSTQFRFEVKGRIDETIVTDDGRLFAGDDVIDFFLAWPGITFAKLIQQSDTRFLLEFVPEQDEHPDKNELSKAFSKFLGYEVKINPRQVKRIAPEPSGKYKLVVSCTHDRFHEAGIDKNDRKPVAA